MTLTAPTDTMCANHPTVTFTASSNAASYTWSPTTYLIDQPNAWTKMFWTNVPGTYTYTVTGTFANGCTASATFTITVLPLPVITVSPSPALYCSGSPVTITASGGLEYDWYPDYGLNVTTGASVIGTPQVTTDYMVVGVGANGCTNVVPFSINAGVTPGVVLTPTPEACGPGTGAVEAYGVGGSFAFTYSWSGPNNFTSNAQSISGVTPGMYTVTVYDYSGCSTVSNTVVSQSTPPSISGVVQTAFCSQATGGVDITVINGAPPFTYLWSDSSTNEDLQNVADGTYTVTVLDSYNCAVTASFVVNSTPPPLLSFTVTNSTCNLPNGAIATTVSNATPPYTFVWNGVTGSSDLSGLTADDYPLVFEDDLGCVVDTTITIVTTQPPVVSSTVIHTTCNLPNGEIDLTVIGDGPFTFSWFPAQGNVEDIAALAAGDYAVTVTDANACTSVHTVTVNPSVLPVLDFVPTQSTCSDANGSVDLTVSLGFGPYSYQWDGTATTQDLSDLTSGTYNVTVTDSNNCVVAGSVLVPDAAAPILDVAVTNATCNLANGNLDLIVNGGTQPLLFEWTPDLGNIEDPNDLVAGTYTVTVTDVNGCTTEISATVGDSPLPQVTVASAFETCGNANGTIDVTVDSGTGPFTFAWSPLTDTTEDVQNLTAGDYSVTVTDSLGCTASQTAFIANVPGPQVTLTAVTESNCSQASGSIDINVTSGTPPYVFEWTAPLDAVEDPINVASGSYNVTVTDANSCTAELNVTVSDAAAPVLDYVITNETCGTQNASIDVTVSGGSAPFTYAWSGSSTGTSQDLNSLSAGTYNITVTDDANCQATAQIIVDGTPAVTVTSAVQDVTCNAANGSIDLTVVTGTAPYTFGWNPPQLDVEDLTDLNGGTYNVTVTDANGCSAALSSLGNIIPVPGLNAAVTHTTCGYVNGDIDLTVTGSSAPYTFSWGPEDLSSIASGSYTVTVTDINNCTLTGTYVVNSSQGVTASATATMASCGNADGTVSASANNGTAPYQYNWGSGFPNNDSLLNVPAASYTVTITDAIGCTASAAAAVTNPDGPVVNYTVTDATCDEPNGSVDLTINGGLPPYQINWSNGLTVEDPNGLVGGSYTVTVSDDNACSSIVIVDIATTTGITIDVIITKEICDGNLGAVDLTANGVGPFTFEWNGNNQTFYTEDLADISSGTYDVTVSAGNGCTVASSAIVAYVPCAPTVSLTAFDATCGLNNGSIDIAIAGGATPYAFAWSNGATDQDLTNLEPGLYIVTITDGNATVSVFDATINAVTAPEVSISITEATCGNTNGAAQANVLNGTSPYNFSWSTGSVASSVNGLGTGAVSVTVTDDIGCTASATSDVADIAGPLLSTDVTSTLCNQANGSIDVTLQGGTPTFTYNWSPSLGNTQDPNNLTAGTYNLTVTDDNGCTAAASVVVDASAVPELTLSVIASTCGNANGSASVVAENGVSPYTYYWDNGSSTNTASGLFSGLHHVTVTDAQGCTVEGNIDVPNIAGAAISGYETAEACSQANGSVDVVLIGGTGPFSFSWSPGGATTEDLSGLVSGSYNLTVVDANGCSSTANFAVGFIASPILTTQASPVTCNADNGLVDLSIDGGIGPYAFSWSNGAAVEDAAQLPPGNYSVTVTDANNCTATTTATISSVKPDSVSVSALPQLVCESQTYNLIASGVVDYLWSPAQGLNEVIGPNVTLFAQDTVTYTVIGTDINGCTSEAQLEVLPSASPQAGITSDPFIGCSPLNVILEGNASGAASAYWSFSNKDTVQGFTATASFASGNYDAMFVAVADNGCADTVELTNYIQSLPTPTADFTATPVGGSDESPTHTFQFANYSDGGDAFAWNFGDTTASLLYQPRHTYANPGFYIVTLTVSGDNGCADTAQQTVLVHEPRVFFIPNTFTPNGDGVNDVFTLYNRGNVTAFRLQVFDRTGEKVYEGNEGTNPWDGTMHGKGLNTGVYVYTAEVTFDNGRIVTRHGDVTLLR